MKQKPNHNILAYSQEAREFSRILRKNMTREEKLLWERIKGKRLGVQFFRQFPILNYVVDFYCKETGTAIEIDGGSHVDMVLEDANRQGSIEKLGVHFLRFSNEEVQNNIERIIKEIKKDIEEYVNNRL